MRVASGRGRSPSVAGDRWVALANTWPMPTKPRDSRKKPLTKNARTTSMKTRKKTSRTAANSDRHALYQESVQCPEAEINFVDRTFFKLRGRRASKLREDFCGTAFSSCEWVARRNTNVAVGFDLHRPTLDWGRRHNLAKLTDEQRTRVHLYARDVRDPGPPGRGVDCILAMNFSYFLFRERPMLVEYFKSCREALAKDGVFFLDIYGGYESYKVLREKRRQRGFKYVWDQAEFNPITNIQKAHIHFEFERGRSMKRAFTYEWRVWSIPEVRDCLADAGFARSIVYWEGDDGKGGGTGVFRPQTVGEADASFIAYVVGVK